MRYHFFLHYGWFFQNLGKEAVRTFMHTTVLHIYFLGSPILWILRKIFELKSEIFRQKLFTVFDFFSLKWESMCSNSWFWFWKSRKKFPKYSTICSLVRVLNTLNLAQTKISKIIEICGQKLFTVFDFFSLKWESMCSASWFWFWKPVTLHTGHSWLPLPSDGDTTLLLVEPGTGAVQAWFFKKRLN